MSKQRPGGRSALEHSCRIGWAVHRLLGVRQTLFVSLLLGYYEKRDQAALAKFQLPEQSRS